MAQDRHLERALCVVQGGQISPLFFVPHLGVDTIFALEIEDNNSIEEHVLSSIESFRQTIDTSINKWESHSLCFLDQEQSSKVSLRRHFKVFHKCIKPKDLSRIRKHATVTNRILHWCPNDIFVLGSSCLGFSTGSCYPSEHTALITSHHSHFFLIFFFYKTRVNLCRAVVFYFYLCKVTAKSMNTDAINRAALI